jgi:hypothetical protein
MGKKAIVTVIGGLTLALLSSCGGGNSGANPSGATPDGGGDDDVTVPGADGAPGTDGAAAQDAPSPPGDDAGPEGADRDGADLDGGEAAVTSQCLHDGSGKVDLTTTGALTLDVHHGNDAYCFGGGTGTTVGYSFGIDTVLASGGGEHLLVNVDVPTGSRDETGTKNVSVTVQTYTNPNLSDARQWVGPCTADITTNTQIDANSVYLTYKIAGTVTCSASLPSAPIDGGPGTDPSLQVAELDLVTSVTFGL